MSLTIYYPWYLLLLFIIAVGNSLRIYPRIKMWGINEEIREIKSIIQRFTWKHKEGKTTERGRENFTIIQENYMMSNPIS